MRQRLLVMCLVTTQDVNLGLVELQLPVLGIVAQLLRMFQSSVGQKYSSVSGM